MKHSCSSLKLSAAALLLALASCPALFAQDYEIRMDRPDAVGTRYHLSTTGKQSLSQVLKQGDKVLDEQKSKYAVEAELLVTVLAVNEKGKNTRIKIEVEKLTRIEGDVKKELAPKGSIITGSWDGQEPAFEMADGALAPETEESLRLLDLITDDPQGPTDDEIFGTKERKKVGDHWEGNTELAAKGFNSHGTMVKKEDVKATVTLDKIVTVGKTECVQLNGVFTCNNFDPPLPPGLTVDKSTMKITFTVKVPVAPSLAVPGEGQSEMTTSVTARGKTDPNAPALVLQITKDRSLTARTTEAK